MKNKNIIILEKQEKKWNEGELSPRPFILDLKKIAKLKKLVQFAFGQSYRDEMGFEIINSKNITQLKNLRDINLDHNKFKIEDLNYIKKITVDPRDDFLKKCKNKDKSIRSEYSLNEKNKAIYDKLDREIKFGNFYHYERTWNNQSISVILKERKNKNKK